MADIIGIYFYFENFPHILIRTLMFLKPWVTLIVNFQNQNLNLKNVLYTVKS